MLKFLQLIAFGSMALVADAQPPAPAAPPEVVVEGVVLEKDTTKEQNIIITKKGNSREKMTIVVDGDNITVNGRPVDAFETTSDGRSIKIRKTDGDVRVVTIPRKIRNGVFMQMSDERVRAKFEKFPYLGLGTKDSIGLLVVETVIRKSAADSAGLKAGDVLLNFNGEKVASGSDYGLGKKLRKLKVGDVVPLTYRRNGKEQTVRVKIGRMPNVQSIEGNFDFRLNADEFDRRAKEWGRNAERWAEGFGQRLDGLNPIDIESIEVTTPNFFNRPRLGLNIEDLPQGDGVKLFEEPEAETVAAKAGLKQGDVIVSTNGTAVKDVDDMRSRVRNLQPGDKIVIGYQRNGQLKSADLVVPKRIKQAGL